MSNIKKITLIGLALIVIVSGIAFYFVQQQSEACTAEDRAQNNCVPAGRCTPPGDPRESTIDCEIKNYEHKFTK